MSDAPSSEPSTGTQNQEGPLPSLATMLALVVGVASLLYPFGLAVMERQLELAYQLDSATAWHVTSLMSNTEVVVHGIHALMSTPTLILVLQYIAMIILVGLGIVSTSHMKVVLKKRFELMARLKVMRENIGRVKTTISETREQNVHLDGEMKALELKRTDQLNKTNVLNDLTIRFASFTYVPQADIDARINTVKDFRTDDKVMEKRLSQLTSHLSESKELADKYDEELKQKEMEISDTEKKIKSNLFERIAPNIILYAAIITPLFLVIFSSLKGTISVLSIIVTYFLSSLGSYFISRHVAASTTENLLRFSRWLLWSVLFAYGAALIASYSTASATANGLLPSVRITRHGAPPVSGSLLNHVDGSWYIVLSPVIKESHHKKIVVQRAQVEEIRGDQTDTVTLAPAGRKTAVP